MSLTAAVAAAIVTIAVVVSQPAYGVDEVADGQWFHQHLQTLQAHQISRGEGIAVAVIDTGVDASHPDLFGSVLPGTDLTNERGDGHTDSDGHGTKMASLIVAHGRVLGVAPAARILPVRVVVVEGARTTAFAAGVRWAVANGAKVISISAGGTGDLVERQAVEAAIAADVVVVAAAGNRPNVSSVVSPASIPGVVAVGAVDKGGNHADVSVSGPELVIAAPGVTISGASLGGKYAQGTGTSDATAIVAGAAALVRSRFPQMKASEVIRRLTATAIDKGAPGRDPDYGYGVLNIVGALTADLPTTTSPSPVKASSAVAAQPAPPRDPLKGWLLILAVVPIAAIVVVAVLWLRRRDRVGL